MWPFPLDWQKVKDKEGDDINVSLTPVERAIVLSALMNYQYIGEKAPRAFNIGEDTDNYDAIISAFTSKLVVG